ncbi:hypothetical protein cyc_03920 [Cyclospora cayetanensis]|uniref:Uncharacterized protein n=1 Tax=Cyclospora cayetanensis TaxID=88456 RepID=A0A1D3CVU1_9EIME|nr:hypothetical protein cyc_03920 [Cyclospora cayetanensis]
MVGTALPGAKVATLAEVQEPLYGHPDSVTEGPLLQEAALMLHQHGFKEAAARLAVLADWQYLDAAVFGAFTLLTLLLVTSLIRGMLAYKREREIEGKPLVEPVVSLCSGST